MLGNSTSSARPPHWPACSIATDRAFIARDMPTLDSFLHCRMIDVSSIKRTIAGAEDIRGSTSASRPRATLHQAWPTSTNPSANCGFLPPHRVRASPARFYQRNRGRRRRAFRQGGRAGRRFGRGAPERLSTSPLISPAGAAGGHGKCSSVGEFRHQICDPGVTRVRVPSLTPGRQGVYGPGPCCPRAEGLHLQPSCL